MEVAEEGLRGMEELEAVEDEVEGVMVEVVMEKTEQMEQVEVEVVVVSQAMVDTIIQVGKVVQG